MVFRAAQPGEAEWGSKVQHKDQHPQEMTHFIRTSALSTADK